MSTSPPTIAHEIERYLRTGDTDPYLAAWPGGVIDGGQRAHADLRGALVREVRRLSEGLSHEPVPDGIGIDFTRSKIEPMVRGLFPRAEQDAVLATLKKSVVYVTSTTLESILIKHAASGREMTRTSPNSRPLATSRDIRGRKTGRYPSARTPWRRRLARTSERGRRGCRART